MRAKILPFPGCLIHVEDLPWGGWIVSYWDLAARVCLAVVEVEPGESVPLEC